MVGILIVSHSKEIADGTKKLASQMMQEPVSLEAVGGTEDGRLGTDANLIYKALERIDKDDGVIILTDLGSAIMNVELAFEWFPEEIQKKFKIANAPLVEGAIFAAVESSLNRDINSILKVIESKALLKKKND